MVRGISVLLCALAVFAFAAHAEEDALMKSLMSMTAPPGWKYEGNPASYNSANLYELVDGEAELYFPYGFKRVIAITYASPSDPKDTIEAEVYEMGSTLDAFGVYSNYRDVDTKPVQLGTDGFAGSTQAMFYQERFFVKMRARGTSQANRQALMPCAQGLSARLPKNTPAPEELELLKYPGLVERSQQYIAQSLLGYDFFSNGVICDTASTYAGAKAFVVIEVTTKTARQALDRYVEYLKSSNATYSWRDMPYGKVLLAKDPLHKGVLARQVGSVVIGVAKLSTPEAGFALFDPFQSHVVDTLRKWHPPKDPFATPPPPKP